ncbi:restriction endonuclease subunit S [Mesobacillus foraminis]|uniref:restriction endonuclease subunit S n=1 Tax=Mesobacillus foraminis TaxID=279826 RepID=UPI000EF4B075|nr:restriction endonuclease subunit S [Mesobacillus foraminis]
MNSNYISLRETIISANTGADAIKRAPIVDTNTGMRCIRIGDISNKRSFDEWGFTNAGEKVIEKFILRKGDILIARTGNTIGVVKYINEDLPSVYNNGLIRLRVDMKKYHPKYIYYALSGMPFKNYVYQISGGTSTQPNMKIDHMLNFKLLHLEYNAQEKIVSLLNSFEDKIEINNKTNKTLEEIAQAIFKRYFVDFEFPNEVGEAYKSSDGQLVDSRLGMIPEGWEVGKLSDLVTIKYGKDHKKLTEGTIPVYGSGGIMRHVDTALYSHESVLIPRKGTLSNVIYTNEPFWSVDTMFYTEMKTSNIAKYVFYFVRSKDLVSMNTGSAVPSMTADILNKLDVIIPSKEVLDTFERFVSPIFIKVRANEEENKNLINIRNALLPKLMSGDIRIGVEEQEEVECLQKSN